MRPVTEWPERFRLTDPRRDPYWTDPGTPWGCFHIVTGRRVLRALACDGVHDSEPVSEWAVGWEHVSVSVRERGAPTASKLPTWAEMCMVKALFWGEEEAVVQFHPPKSVYVNLAEVLHLWRHASIPVPDPRMVG